MDQLELPIPDTLQPNEIWVIYSIYHEEFLIENSEYDDSNMGFSAPGRYIKGGRSDELLWTSTRDERSLEHLKKRMIQISKEKEFYDKEKEKAYIPYQTYKLSIEWIIKKESYFQLKNK